MDLEFQWCGNENHDWERYKPTRKTPGSSGLDVAAYLSKPLKLKSGERILVPTGWKVRITKGNELQVRSRSGMSYKYGVVVLNSPGTIDQDYQGEIKVLLFNSSKDDFTIVNGMAIAQLVLCPVDMSAPVFVANKPLFEFETERKEGGFGSTGDYK